jgi:hypothetical protein
MNGPGPNEQIVRVPEASGQWEEVIANSSSVIGGNMLQTSAVLGQKDGNVLVELPRESATGKWRLWVRDTDARP